MTASTERSRAPHGALDCFVAALLAMTKESSCPKGSDRNELRDAAHILRNRSDVERGKGESSCTNTSSSSCSVSRSPVSALTSFYIQDCSRLRDVDATPSLQLSRTDDAPTREYRFDILLALTTATGFSAARPWKSCGKTCAPSAENAGPTGTSRRRNSGRHGSKAARKCFILTARRMPRRSANRISSKTGGRTNGAQPIGKYLHTKANGFSLAALVSFSE